MASDTPLVERLRGLVERLEKASGPKLELDGMVWCAVNGYEYVMWDGAGCVYTDPNAPNWDRGIKHVQASIVRPYTASLDAAVALVERVLPGRGYSVEHLPCYGPYHSASIWSDTAITIGNGRGHSSAIALVIATLRALSQEQRRPEAHGPPRASSPRSSLPPQ